MEMPKGEKLKLNRRRAIFGDLYHAISDATYPCTKALANNAWHRSQGANADIGETSLQLSLARFDFF
jgi:hypothetical protein